MKKRTPRLRFNDPSLTKAFSVIADHIDSLPVSRRVRAGSNILLNETPSEVIINGTPSGSSGGDTHICVCPLDIVLVAADPDDTDNENKKMEISAGSVNSVAVGNRMPDDEIGKDDEGFVVIEVEMSATGGVTTAEIKWKEGTSPPDPIPVTEDEPPSDFSIPLAFISKLKVQRLLGCYSVSAYPRVTCIKTTGDEIKYNYTISVYPS